MFGNKSHKLNFLATQGLIAAVIGIFLFLNYADASEPKQRGEWYSGQIDGSEGLYAATINDSGDIFGEYCAWQSQTCTWLISVDSTCEKGSQYPALGNTDVGAAPLKLTCDERLESASHTRLFFSDWKELEELIMKGKRFGLAVPMQSDQFKVHRFSLDGMSEIQASMEKSFWSELKRRGVKPKTGTSTTTL